MKVGGLWLYHMPLLLREVHSGEEEEEEDQQQVGFNDSSSILSSVESVFDYLKRTL